MKIDVTQGLKNYDGKDIYLDSDNKVKATLREVLVAAANTETKGKPMTAENKAKAYQLSQKMYKDNDVNLTIDDMAFLKERVYEIFRPVVAGQIEEIFEGKK